TGADDHADDEHEDRDESAMSKEEREQARDTRARASIARIAHSEVPSAASLRQPARPAPPATGWISVNIRSSRIVKAESVATRINVGQNAWDGAAIRARAWRVRAGSRRRTESDRE